MLRPAPLIVLVLFMRCASASFAACPLNHFSIGITNQFSSLPVDSRTSLPVYPDLGFSTASYNVPAGTLSLGFISYSLQGSGGGVYVEDDFSIVGLPSGTPVSLTAHMTGQLRGPVTPPSYCDVQATLKDLNGNSQVAETPTLTYDLSLPVQAIVGQTFRLHFELSGNAYGSSGTVSGAGNAEFSFAGLPPGVMVTSCQGYMSGPAVASRVSSWGRVKSIYW